VSYRWFIALVALLIALSCASLFIGVRDISLTGLLSDDADQQRVFLVSRLPRLLTASHGDAISFEFIQEKNPDILFVIDRDAAIARRATQRPRSLIMSSSIRPRPRLTTTSSTLTAATGILCQTAWVRLRQ
jgi:hypothetical protein